MPDTLTLEELQQMTATAKLARKSLPTTTHKVYIDSSFVDAYEAANAELDIVAIRQGLASQEYLTAQETLVSAEVMLKVSTVVLQLKAITRKEFEKLKLENVPTEQQIADLLASDNVAPEWNVETFVPTLIQRCCIEPQLTLEEVLALEETCTGTEYGQLFQACLSLHFVSHVDFLGKD